MERYDLHESSDLFAWISFSAQSASSSVPISIQFPSSCLPPHPHLVPVLDALLLDLPLRHVPSDPLAQLRVAREPPNLRLRREIMQERIALEFGQHAREQHAVDERRLRLQREVVQLCAADEECPVGRFVRLGRCHGVFEGGMARRQRLGPVVSADLLPHKRQRTAQALTGR